MGMRLPGADNGASATIRRSSADAGRELQRSVWASARPERQMNTETNLSKRRILAQSSSRACPPSRGKPCRRDHDPDGRRRGRGVCVRAGFAGPDRPGTADRSRAVAAALRSRGAGRRLLARRAHSARRYARQRAGAARHRRCPRRKTSCAPTPARGRSISSSPASRSASRPTTTVG